MKKINGYICEKCGQIWNDEKRALECENDHVGFKKMKIGWAKFNDYETISDIDNKDKKLQSFIPQIVKMEYRDKENADKFECKSFVAYYELKRLVYTYDEDEKHNTK